MALCTYDLMQCLTPLHIMVAIRAVMTKLLVVQKGPRPFGPPNFMVLIGQYCMVIVSRAEIQE